MTELKLEDIIREIELTKGKVHMVDILITSDRMDEVKEVMGGFVKDICVDLDGILDNLRAFSKREKGANYEEKNH